MNGIDGTTVFPVEPLNLLGEALIKLVDVRHVLRVVLPQLEVLCRGLGQQPVGMAAIAALTVIPRADTQEHLEMEWGE